jgi:intein/homing endonuclease
MGRFIGDGWTNENDVCICGHINENEEILKCIEDININFGLPNVFNKRIVMECNRVDYSIFSKELRDVFLLLFGKDSYTKKIPEFVFRLKKEFISSLLRGLYDSDGYRRGNTQQLTTTSNYLSFQVPILEGYLGNTPSLRLNKSDKPFWSIEYGIDEKVKREKLIKNMEGNVIYPIQKIEIERFKRGKERVYDLTVEDDNSFVVGLSAVHNCHRIGQKDTVFIYPMVVKGTIDEYVFNMIEKKRIEITKALDNEDYHSNVEESILAELLAMLREKYGKKKEESDKKDDADPAE